MSKKSHNNSAFVFLPDSRNIGGRRQITDLIYNHQMSLINAKPMINTRVSTPKSIPSKKKVPYREILSYKEVFESFRRVGNVKWSNFSSPPKTFYLKGMLQGKNTKAFKTSQYEHQLHLNSQKRRIEDLTNVSQRKKNTFDSTVYPSLFFRRKPENFGFSGKSQIKNYEIPIKNSEMPYARNPEEEVKREKKIINPNIKEEMIEEDDALDLEENGYVLLPIPQIKGKNEESYNELKQKLIEIIFEYRVFRNDDLESLFGRTLINNKHMDSAKLHEIFREIQEEFDS